MPFLACTNIPVQGKSMNCLMDHSIFAVLDGHGGGFASKFCCDYFLEFFSRRPELAKYVDLKKHGVRSRQDTCGVILLKQALIQTCAELDKELTRQQRAKTDSYDRSAVHISSSGQQQNPCERSGSTCVVVLLTPSHVICANVGDSRAILRRNGKVLPLSFDQKPSEIPEKQRILDAGGEVKGKRIDGDLALSRAFGDYVYKEDKTRGPNEQKVIAAPELVVYPRDHGSDEFIILACDGIWDVATNYQCSEFVQKLLSSGETNLVNICEESIDTCLDMNSRDNMTLMIIGLPAMKVDRSSSAVMSNALWGLRASRTARRFASRTTAYTRNLAFNVGRDLRSERAVSCVRGPAQVCA
jgi:serine/threonine protein phosphatase PrpC